MTKKISNKIKSKAEQFIAPLNLSGLATTGIYVGDDPQFVGRVANLIFDHSRKGVYAQFNEGRLWETHGRLLFHIEDWSIPDDGE